MDKTLLKKFAIDSRAELVEKVKTKINSLYIEEELKSERIGELYILSKDQSVLLTLSREDYDSRELLKKRVKELSIEQVIEEASYTWFNRIIAIRYMELNYILPLTTKNESLGIRILSDKNNELDPEILKYSNINNSELDLNINKEKYDNLSNDNEKFKYILIKVCEKLGKVIPQVFDGVTDYINLLIPDNMIKEDRIIGKLVKDIPTDNFNDVEVIGWLYQYYNQTEKDRVIGAKKAYEKTEIPYATQLFTPDWIVKYMVENSLGKYWLENHANKEMQESFKYYIEDAKQDKEVQKELDTLKNPNLKPQEITFIDPCCGSGHILVYAFEVLYKIYESFGYNKQDIPKLILENNLYGLDIDDRAGQLAILSVFLKAREYDKKLFSKQINLNIMSIQESNNINESLLYDVKDKETNEIIHYVLNVFKDAKEYGSILKVDKMNYEIVLNKIANIHSIQDKEIKQKLEPLFRQAILLSNKYDIATTNPPYLGQKLMSEKLKKYINNNFTDAKSDLFSAFILQIIFLTKIDKYISMVTPYVWMFISSYENLRKKIIKKGINSLIQLEYNSFEGACVPVATFSFRNFEKKYNGVYIKLSDFPGSSIQSIKTLEAINTEDCKYKYKKSNEMFSNIDGNPLSYWGSDKIIDTFVKGKSLGSLIDTKVGLSTGNNNIFIRNWYEVDFQRIGMFPNTIESSRRSYQKWFALNKGGDFKKWYGNRIDIVNWENNGKQIKEYKGSTIRNEKFYFKESIACSAITSSINSFRFYPAGAIFDVNFRSIFVEKEKMLVLLALFNSKIVEYYCKLLSPTMALNVYDIDRIPILSLFENSLTNQINKLVNININISKQDWDSFETSWEFKSNPLIEFKGKMPELYDTNIIPKTTLANLSISKNNYGEDTYIIDNMPLNSKIEHSFNRWEKYCEKRFNQLKANEEELNIIFIDIYGLQNELTPEVENKDITIKKANREKNIKSLISYAVGCMFGRYSIYKEGLLFAGGKYDNEEIKNILFENISNTVYGKIPKNEKSIITDFYIPDLDNIIPINDNNYFMDDIVVKFKEFIKVAFGEKTLYENLDYIAETLGKRNTETSEDTIRRYFINDFYKDHVKTYQKRPIYWLIDSGKANGFKCLIYMHRYDEKLLAKIRIDYLHKIQKTLDNEYEKIKFDLTGELDFDKRKKLLNIQNDFSKKLTEIKDFDDKLSHLALQKINIDLDDGVIANYDRFKDILGTIK